MYVDSQEGATALLRDTAAALTAVRAIWIHLVTITTLRQNGYKYRHETVRIDGNDSIE